MNLGRLVSNRNGTRHGLASERDGSGKIVHYRTFRTDLNPAIKRTETIAKNVIPGKSEYAYLGSVSMDVVADWVRKQGKTMHDFATDKDLKAKFMAYYRSEYSKLMASSYQERSLAVNRTLTSRR